VAHFNKLARVIAVHRLTGSLINTCYDHQLRSDRNTPTDLKPVIELLRSLSDVLHNLYVSIDGETVSSQPPLTFNLIYEEDGPLAQCTTELHLLEKVLESGEWPLNKMAVMDTLGNLGRIKVALDVSKR
jgi:hypothetical protein